MITYEWDPRKAERNEKVHGVTFQQASLALEDPALFYLSDRIIGGELRHQAIGRIENVVLLTVAHTIRGDDENTRVRIISARTAERWERELYRAYAGG